VRQGPRHDAGTEVLVEDVHVRAVGLSRAVADDSIFCATSKILFQPTKGHANNEMRHKIYNTSCSNIIFCINMTKFILRIQQ
jgi:hypothetical protein